MPEDSAHARPTEVRIPIKEATARDLLALDRGVEAARAQLAVKEQRLQDSLRSLFTEHDIPTGSRVVTVTGKPPFELVVIFGEEGP